MLHLHKGHPAVMFLKAHSLGYLVTEDAAYLLLMQGSKILVHGADTMALCGALQVPAFSGAHSMLINDVILIDGVPSFQVQLGTIRKTELLVSPTTDSIEGDFYDGLEHAFILRDLDADFDMSLMVGPLCFALQGDILTVSSDSSVPKETLLPSMPLSIVRGPIWNGLPYVLALCKDHVVVLSAHQALMSQIVPTEHLKICSIQWSDYYGGLLAVLDDAALFSVHLFQLSVDIDAVGKFNFAQQSLHRPPEQPVDLPREYCRDIQGALSSPDGCTIAVWARRGFCFCDLRRRHWKLFGKVAQEQRLQIMHADWTEDNLFLVASNSSQLYAFDPDRDLDLRECIWSVDVQEPIARLYCKDAYTFALLADGALLVLKRNALVARAQLSLPSPIHPWQLNAESNDGVTKLLLLHQGSLYELSLDVLAASAGGEVQAKELLRPERPIVRFWRFQDPAIVNLTWTLVQDDSGRLKLTDLSNLTMELPKGYAVDLDETDCTIRVDAKSHWLVSYILYTFVIRRGWPQIQGLLGFWSQDGRLPLALEHVIVRCILERDDFEELMLPLHDLLVEHVGFARYQRSLARLARTLETDDAVRLFASTFPVEEMILRFIRDCDIDSLMIAFRLGLSCDNVSNGNDTLNEKLIDKPNGRSSATLDAQSGKGSREWLRPLCNLLIEQERFEELEQACDFLARLGHASRLDSLLQYWQGEFKRRRWYAFYFRLKDISSASSVSISSSTDGECIKYSLDQLMAIVYWQLQLSPWNLPQVKASKGNQFRRLLEDEATIVDPEWTRAISQL
jgi:hypothetical protein